MSSGARFSEDDIDKIKNHAIIAQIRAQLGQVVSTQGAKRDKAKSSTKNENLSISGQPITIEIEPVAKPRMTQRDKWAKRPVVERYRAFCDVVRGQTEKLRKIDVYRIDIEIAVAVPKSWSQKKKAEHIGRPHRQRPDVDNYVKAVLDAILKEDSGIYSIRAVKKWAEKGSLTITGWDFNHKGKL